MSYKIAIASSDGVTIDRSFREAEEFLIIEVDDKGSHELLEVRRSEKETTAEKQTQVTSNAGRGCAGKTGCGGGSGCSGADSPKLSLIADCRCLICTKIGFKIYKELEKKAISVFEIDLRIEDALKKIIKYYNKVDTHQSLREIAKGLDS
ncbi:MAG: hypothetical protein J6B85_13145 [Lachnospiraceae bacterium]|nr:hypothetical protein [Lachnospiraceae bacterium]